MKSQKILALLVVFILLLTLAACTDMTTTTDPHNPLPTIGSTAKLKRLIGDNRKGLFGFRMGALEMADEAQKESESGSKDYSSTNVQVDGIDEGDIVKTDGNYLYQVSGTNIVITQLYPIEEAKVVHTIKLNEKFGPNEIFIDGDKLIVLGYLYNQDFYGDEMWHLGRGTYLTNSTMLQVYDISNITKPELKRELEIEGHLITSRKKDSYVYLVTNKYLGWGDIPENPSTQFRDSAKGNELTQKPLTDVYYFPHGELSGFINIVAIDIENHKKEATIETFLGNGHNIYMSHNNLYIALTTYKETKGETIIHKFGIDKDKITYKADGKVDGWVLNQFSMDEYQGNFRIATTTHDEVSTNNLYVLDSNMKTIGKLENLAPTERIYSARFIGEKAYLITFEIVDPLFVIDLQNPKSPKVLGELKIPGFSNYLHPIDENHLLGIGRDTTVTTMWGREVAIELGIRLTIFDVTDPNNPKEKHVTTLGGRGSYTEAQYNHKAIYYHNNKLAFPVWLTKPSNNHMDYGNVNFIGAYIYQVDPDIGFTLHKAISHLTDQQMSNYYDHSNYYQQIKRIISIEDYTYTISDGKIQIHDPNFEAIKTINLR